MFIKIAGKLFSWSDINLIEEDYAKSQDYPGHETVRIQYRNREDRVEVIAGTPVHIKTGVYEVPPEYCEAVRWFFKTCAVELGIVDVLGLWEKRDEIESSRAILAQQQKESKVADTKGKGRLLKMVPKEEKPE